MPPPPPPPDYNVTVTITANLPPGFDIKPVQWCKEGASKNPSTGFAVDSLQSFADALQNLTAAVSTPALVQYANDAFPFTVNLLQNLSAAAAVSLLAEATGQTASLGLPVLVLGPNYPLQPGQPVPTVALNLSSCIGCLPLSSKAGPMTVFLNNLLLVGLEPSALASGAGLAELELPLWAFGFNRTNNSTQLNLSNVTLYLNKSEFLAIHDMLQLQSTAPVTGAAVANLPYLNSTFYKVRRL